MWGAQGIDGDPDSITWADASPGQRRVKAYGHCQAAAVSAAALLAPDWSFMAAKAAASTNSPHMMSYEPHKGTPPRMSHTWLQRRGEIVDPSAAQLPLLFPISYSMGRPLAPRMVRDGGVFLHGRPLRMNQPTKRLLFQALDFLWRGCDEWSGSNKLPCWKRPRV
jgi:hypothetical protein